MHHPHPGVAGDLFRAVGRGVVDHYDVVQPRDVRLIERGEEPWQGVPFVVGRDQNRHRQIAWRRDT